MANLNNRITKPFVRAAQESIINSTIFRGYDKAANVCFDVIDRKINELNVRMGNGKFLSKEEQYFLGKLNGLKQEIYNELLEGEVYGHTKWEVFRLGYKKELNQY